MDDWTRKLEEHCGKNPIVLSIVEGLRKDKVPDKEILEFLLETGY